MLRHSLSRWLAISCLACIVAACGGGGGGSGGSNSGTNSSEGTSNNSSKSPSASPDSISGIGRRVSLSWTIPSTRLDGSPLAVSAITSYRLFYTREGSAPGEDVSVVINKGSTTNTNLTLPLSGTYTFAITAIDNNGNESPMSDLASVTIN